MPTRYNPKVLFITFGVVAIAIINIIDAVT